MTSPTQWHQCKQESYKGTQLGQIKYIVNYTEQTMEGIQATYMELLVRRAMKPVLSPNRTPASKHAPHQSTLIFATHH
jgi:hypothetical protein